MAAEEVVWVDAHCHVGPGTMAAQQPDELLRDMDRLGVSRSVLVPWDAALAVYNREGNDYVLAQAAAHPDRFWAFAGVNPWYGKAAVDELRRAARQGACGLKLAPHYQGFQLSDPIVRPLVEAAIELGLPVYATTGVPVAAMPMQLCYLARTYPEGRFIEGRYGFPDFWTDALPSVIDTPNIYVDMAYNAPSTILNAIAAVGAKRVLFSSDAPYLSLQNEVEKAASLPVSRDVLARIAGGTMMELLKGGRRE